jgi:hypothetical protein
MILGQGRVKSLTKSRIEDADQVAIISAAAAVVHEHFNKPPPLEH